MHCNPVCPFCEEPILSVITEVCGPDFGTTVITYVHEEGERHFLIIASEETVQNARLLLEESDG